MSEALRKAIKIIVSVFAFTFMLLMSWAVSDMRDADNLCRGALSAVTTGADTLRIGRTLNCRIGQ